MATGDRGRGLGRAAMPTAAREADGFVPLIVHVIYRLDVGGLENGLVNLINRIPSTQYRHAIVCLTDYTEFHRRIDREDVPIFALHKRPGNDLNMLVRVWRLVRQLRPDIVHTRNLAALECAVPAWLAGARTCIHGEHGRDMLDVDGTSRRYQWVRRLYRPFVKAYVPLSKDLEQYLVSKVAVAPKRIWQIYNGVDTERFAPADSERQCVPAPGFSTPGTVVVGTVGRLQPVKDQVTLADAFIELLTRRPGLKSRLRLAIVGDGPLRDEVAGRLQAAGVADLAWLPGERSDVPELMRALDIFVLPSLAEGVSNTVLEAMATGLPVVATRVGGNPELIVDGVTGSLVPPSDPKAMAQALSEYVDNDDRRRAHGCAGRERVLERFSMQVMVDRYIALYDRFTQRHAHKDGDTAVRSDHNGLGG
ncbi:MAG: TIGR03088 family PEP-CTERM/XrtA system glycosyltransferase [Gammaproteobacteria bacterium]